MENVSACVRVHLKILRYIRSIKRDRGSLAGKGATFLHLVDLDGALAGRSVNEETIKKIISSVNIPVEIGGGIRSEEAIKNMLALGVKRVIIGTKAVEEPEFLKDMVEKFGADAIAAGVDAKDGMVAIQGWEQVSTVTATDLCLKMKEYGVKHIIYTDISQMACFQALMFNNKKKADGKQDAEHYRIRRRILYGRPGRLFIRQGSRAIIGKALYEKTCRFGRGSPPF